MGRTRDTGNQAAVVNTGRRSTCVLSLDSWIEKPIIKTSLTSLGETACPESKYLWNTQKKLLLENNFVFTLSVQGAHLEAWCGWRRGPGYAREVSLPLSANALFLVNFTSVLHT